ncbi:hypothetical protein [Lentzea sp. NPDC092896]|uniref:hypothetical protein n=1 Tax=Lentzea sp. NPDC092896 TaxID=3364127 RepID=UPI0038223B89
MIEHITHGPLAGFTITSGEDLLNDAGGQVAVLHAAGQLGYIAPSQEWVDGTGEPLPETLQFEADQMVQSGLLPEFKEWFA